MGFVKNVTVLPMAKDENRKEVISNLYAGERFFIACLGYGTTVESNFVNASELSCKGHAIGISPRFELVGYLVRLG